MLHRIAVPLVLGAALSLVLLALDAAPASAQTCSVEAAGVTAVESNPGVLDRLEVEGTAPAQWLKRVDVTVDCGTPVTKGAGVGSAPDWTVAFTAAETAQAGCKCGSTVHVSVRCEHGPTGTIVDSDEAETTIKCTDEDIGACCWDDAVCSAPFLVSEAYCVNPPYPYSVGKWYGAGSTSCPGCEPEQPEKGACCVGGQCSYPPIMMSEAECMDPPNDGTWYGAGSTSCTDCEPDLTLGACCITDSTTGKQACLPSQTTKSQCEDAPPDGHGGKWEAGKTTCTDCGPPGGAGACCRKDGSCEQTSKDDCQDEDEKFFEGASCPADNRCGPPQVKGACCVSFGGRESCTETLPFECDGRWVGGPCIAAKCGDDDSGGLGNLCSPWYCCLLWGLFIASLAAALVSLAWALCQGSSGWSWAAFTAAMVIAVATAILLQKYCGANVCAYTKSAVAAMVTAWGFICSSVGIVPCDSGFCKPVMITRTIGVSRMFLATVAAALVTAVLCYW